MAIGRCLGAGKGAGREGKGLYFRDKVEVDKERELFNGQLIESARGCDGGMGGGRGRCSLDAASLSPGDSNATAGSPYVAPNKLASAPPKECPTSQILADGYILMRSSRSFWNTSSEKRTKDSVSKFRFTTPME